MDFSLFSSYKHYCDVRRENDVEKVVEIKKRRYFSALYFYMYIFHFDHHQNREISIENSTSLSSSSLLHLLTGPFVAYPTEYIFFLSYNHSGFFSHFLCVCVCLFRFFFASCCQFMLMFSSYILVLMKEEKNNNKTHTHTHTHTDRCVCMGTAETGVDGLKLYLPILNSTAHIRSAQSSIVAPCK